MARRLNWNLLKTFESVARNGTLQGAANELFVTGGAVSKQLVALEKTLGERLFEREAGRLVLTDGGRNFLISVRGPVAELESALAPWKKQRPPAAVRITSVPSMSAQVLSALMPGLLAQFPEVAFDITTSSRVVSFVDEEWDIGLRIGKGDWKETEMTELPGSELMLIAGADIKKIRSAAILQHESAIEWVSWTRMAGDAAVRAERVVMMNDWNSILSAVAENAGIALVPKLLALASLDKGAVQRVSPVMVPGRLRFYVVSAPKNHPQRARRSSSVGAVKEWLSHEIAALARTAPA